MRVWILAASLLLLISSGVFSEIVLSPELHQALKLSNDGQLLESYAALQEYVSKNPDELQAVFLLALVKSKTMWLAPYSESDREELLTLLKHVEDIAEPDMKTDPDALFFYSASHGLHARLTATENSWWSTAQLGKKMKSGAQDLIKQYPDYYESYYLLGSFNYFADVLPGHVKFMRSLFFLPGGNRKEGLKQLLLAYEKGTITSEAAGRTLALIYTYYEKQHAYAVQLCDLLLHNSPNNFEIALYKGINLYYEGEFEKSLAWLTTVREKIMAYSRKNNASEEEEVQADEEVIVSVYFPMEREVRYWISRNLIQLKEYERAREILNQLAEPELHDPYWIQRGVFLSLAQIDYLNDEPEKAEARISRVMRWQDVKSAHDKAKLLRKKKAKIGKFEIDFLL